MVRSEAADLARFPRIAVAVLATTVLAACASMPAPAYQPSVDTTLALVAHHGAVLQVGPFTAGGGVENASLGVRGGRLEAGSDGTYAGYLRDALIAELRAAGRHDEGSGLRISGVLTGNRLDGSGVRTGKASVSARFRMESDGVVVYERDLQATHEWESSFIGAIAYTAAVDNYATTVQKLLNQLLTDPAFIRATARAADR